MKKYIAIILGLFLLLHGYFAFAEDTATYTKDFAGTMTQLVKVFSWLRIPIANLTGKLMTNTLVSGEVFDISEFLFQARNVCRVITNFIIVGIVLNIIYDLATSGKSDQLGSKVFSIALTVIGINASRFLLSAAVDLGTMATLGVSNIGSAIVQSMPSVQANAVRGTVCAPQEVIIDFQGTQYFQVKSTPDCINTPVDPEGVMKSIMPTPQDMSGPFRYFGIGVFRLFDYLSTDNNNSDLKAITISLLVKLFLMGMFLAPLVALLVVNLARVFLIWIWFITAPFIVLKRGTSNLGIKRLDPLFGDSGGDSTFGSGSGYFDISNIIGAIFAPASITAIMFLAIITITSLFGSLSKSGQAVDLEGNLNNIQSTSNQIQDKLNQNYGISIDGHTVSVPGAGTMTFEGEIIQDSAKYIMGSFGYLIICMMTIGMMRAIFRAGTNTSKLLDKIGKTVMDNGKTLITQTLVQLPVGVGGKMVSLDQLNQRFGFDKLLGMAQSNYIKPVQASQNRLVEQTKQKWLRKMGIGYDVAFTGSVSYEGSKKPSDPKFKTDTADFFKKLIKAISDPTKDGGSVDFNNSYFTSSIESWLKNGGAEYVGLEDKYYETDEKTSKPDKSKPKVYDAMQGSKKLGGFINAVLSKDFYDTTNPDIDKYKKDDKTVADIKRKPEQFL